MRTSCRSIRFVILLVASVGIALIGSVRAVSEPAARLLTQGGPDEYGYRFIDSINEPTGPVFGTVFQDISATGAALPIISENGFTVIQIPILVRMYGQNWGTPPAGSGLTVVTADAEISANGFVALLGPGQADPTPGMFTNQTLPNTDDRIVPGGFLAVLWDEWSARGANDSAQWEVIGTAPNRRFIVQWTDWSFAAAAEDMTMQVQITESDGFADSEIFFIYQGVNAGFELGTSATIGIQGGLAPAPALLYSFNDVPIANPTEPDAASVPRVIRFYTPPAVVNLSDPTGLAQFLADGTTPLATGGTAGLAVVLNATTDNPGGASRRVQVEIQPTAQAFTGAPTHNGASSTGGLLLVSVSSLNSGDYHWRARVHEPATGFISNWIAFGGNDNPTDPTDPNGATDFEVEIGVGGPDAFGYTYADDRAPNGPVYATEFEDITATGTAITFQAYASWPATDEGQFEAPLGFSFSFYGNTYTTTWVNTNGFVKFGSSTVSGTNGELAYQATTLPSTQQPNIIAVKWGDRTGVLGWCETRGTAPDRRFIVHWTSGSQVYQVKLYEDGQIVLVHAAGNTSGETVGIQNDAGTIGLLYSFGGSPESIVNNRPIRFALPPAPPPPASPPSGGGGSGGRCGSVGLDVMVPLGLLFLWRQFKRHGRRRLPGLLDGSVD